MGWPTNSVTFATSARLRVSLAPPGGEVTTSRIGLVGKAGCAWAVLPRLAAATSTRSRQSRATSHASAIGSETLDYDAARLLIVLEREELARLRLVEKLAEGAKAVVGLVEPGLA